LKSVENEGRKMTILRVVLIVLIVALGFGLVWRLSPRKSKLVIATTGTHFPVVSGYNLDRQEFEFPTDFAGDYNLVIIAFQQVHQYTVNAWIPFAQEIEAAFPGFVYYEFPTIAALPAFSRTFINEGMRAGIPDQTARERTITLYLDKNSFRSALDITDEDEISIFLVDRDGDILWRETGEFTQEKAGQLMGVLQGN
jgi:hypothetical protein